MNFNEFLRKAVSAGIALGLTATSVAPAFATSQAADGIKERVPVKGARLSFVDIGTASGTTFSPFSTKSATELKRAYSDMNFHDNVPTMDMGEWLVYGDGEQDEYGEDSYEGMIFEFGTAYTSMPELAIIAKNSSNSGNDQYDIIGYNSTSGAYFYEEVDEVPSLNTGSLEDFYMSAFTQGTAMTDSSDYDTLHGAAFDGTMNYVDATDGTTGNMYFATDIFSEIRRSNQVAGDPDIMTTYYDEIYVYTKTTNGDEVAVKYDMNKSSVKQDVETPEVEGMNVVVRGTRGRVTWMPVMEEGVTGYEVEILNGAIDGATSGTNDFGGAYSTMNGIAATGEEDASWETQTPVVFFTAMIDDSYDVTVYTLNAEGDKSDGVEMTDVDADRVEFANGNVFPDVMSDNVFYDHIQYLYKLAIIDGYGDGEFKPDEAVTRGQLSKFIVNAFNIPRMTGGEMFSDVDADNTFFDYVQSLKNANIVSGEGGAFNPDDSVTRGQATKFIMNAANFYNDDNVSASSNCFADVNGTTFESFICGLVDYNDEDIQPVMSGFSDGNFGPDESLTRGQMSKVVLNAAGSIAVDKDANELVSFINHFNAFAYTTTNVFGGDDYAAYGGNVMTTGTAGDNYYVRPFVAPIAVSDFDADGDPTSGSGVSLAWENLGVDTKDNTVSGYIIERRERDGGDEDWTQVDGLSTGDCTTGTSYNSGVADTALDTDMTNGIIRGHCEALLDSDANDDTRYEYRIAAFKYIPWWAAEDDHDTAAEVEADNDEERDYMVVGPWVFTSVKTPADN